MNINRNLSTLDRAIRGLVGISTLTLGALGGSIVNEPILQVFLIGFGLLNLLSLATGWCAVYQIANLSTYSKNED